MSLHDVKPGDVVVRHWWNGFSNQAEKRTKQFVRVTRVTKTLVVVGRERYRKKDGRRFGDGGLRTFTWIKLPKRYEKCGHEPNMLPNGNFECEVCELDYVFAHCVVCKSTRLEQNPGDPADYKCPAHREETRG